MTRPLRAQYDDLRPRLERLRDEALFVIQEAVAREGIKVHAFHTRIKEFESVQRKLVREEQSASNGASLNDLNDLVGLRIVCLFLSDIPQLGTSLGGCVDVIHEDNKIDGADVSSFGYQSVHFVCRFPEQFSGPRYDSLKGMPFEVQVRTIAMDAWAAASHYLDYKTELGVPIGLRKDFYALSGLFYVADTHFEMFYKEAQLSREKLRATAPSPLLECPLDLDTLSQYIKIALPDRKRADNIDISDLLTELLAADYKFVKEVDRQLKRVMEVFLLYERDNPPAMVGDDDNAEVIGQFSDVGVIRVLLEIADDHFLQVRIDRDNIGAQAFERFAKYKKLLSTET